MKILKPPSVRTVVVNGCVIDVPAGLHYLVISYNGWMDAYETKPYLREGIWVHDVEVGVSLGRVELEDGDEWTQVFLVYQNRFRTYDDCDA